MRQLTLVELYLERATDAWHALQMQELADRNLLKLVGKIHFGTGALRRTPESSYRGTSYDFISALPQSSPNAKHPGIAYTLDSKRARAEVHAHRAQATLVRELVSRASNDAASDPEIGRTLFNLLIPVEMEPFLGGSGELVMELDAGTAGIPWELLDTSPEADAADKRPWAIRSKLIRKMQLEEFRTSLRPAGVGDKVLIIGDPKTASPLYPPSRARTAGWCCLARIPSSARMRSTPCAAFRTWSSSIAAIHPRAIPRPSSSPTTAPSSRRTSPSR